MHLRARLLAFVLQHHLGVVFGQGCGYQFPGLDGGRLRFLDVSFVRKGRLAGGCVPGGWVAIPPDLVVESLSPGETAEGVISKAQVWLDAGVRLVWILYPMSRSVLVMRHGVQGTFLGENDDFDGFEVVPGFVLRVGEIFPTDEEVS